MWGPPPPPPDDGSVVPLRPYGLGVMYGGMVRVLRRSPAAVLAAAAVVVAASLVFKLAGRPTVRETVTDDGYRRHTEIHPYVGHTVLSAVSILGTWAAAALLVPLVLRLVAGSAPQPVADLHRRGWRAAAGSAVLLLLSVPFVALDPLLGGGSGERALALLLLVVVFPLVVWAYVGLGLTGVVAVAEDVTLPAAARRSWQLVRNSWWRTFGLTLMFEIASIAGSVVVFVVAAARGAGLDEDTTRFSPTVAAVVIGTVFAFVATPMLLIGQVLLYVDLRCRKEGLAWSLDAARRGDGRPALGPGGAYDLRPAAPPPAAPSAW